MISVRELTKLYGNFTAVRSLSFDVGVGEMLGLVGPNGAGKTTTLRCLAGIIAPSQRIGRPSRGTTFSASRSRQSARWRSFPTSRICSTTSRSKSICASSRGCMASPTSTRAFRSLLDELELTEKRRSLPGELSRGMRQKLAIACGLLHSPSALILDEPLTGLDPGRHSPHARDDCRARGRGCRGDPELAPAAISSRSCARSCSSLRRGECVAYGTIDEIIATQPGARRPVARGRLPRADRAIGTRRVNAFLYLIWSSARNRFCRAVGRACGARATRPRSLVGALLHLGVSLSAGRTAAALRRRFCSASRPR